MRQSNHYSSDGWCGFGLSRNKAYEAASRGEIPTLRFGKRIVVPTVPLRRMLGLEPVFAY